MTGRSNLPPGVFEGSASRHQELTGNGAIAPATGGSESLRSGSIPRHGRFRAINFDSHGHLTACVGY